MSYLNVLTIVYLEVQDDQKQDILIVFYSDVFFVLLDVAVSVILQSRLVQR